MKIKIQESAENYLEAIYMLRNEKPEVRSIDIANELEFSRPSVSVAMKNLRENGYIEMDELGHISLTEKGSGVAIKVYERHVKLTQWLISLGVDKKIAQQDACRMEHVLSEESFVAIRRHIASSI